MADHRMLSIEESALLREMRHAPAPLHVDEIEFDRADPIEEEAFEHLLDMAEEDWSY